MLEIVFIGKAFRKGMEKVRGEAEEKGGRSLLKRRREISKKKKNTIRYL